MKQISKSIDFAHKVQSLSLQKPIDELLGEIIGKKWFEYRKNWDMASKKEIIPPFPLFVLFENQYACNLKCIMCVHGQESIKRKYSYKGSLEIDTFYRLIDECAEHNCPSICMNNINEPLLEKDIFERIRYASDKGIIDIHMNTNATLLDRDKSEMLLESGLTRLLIGFDGFTRDEYENVRKGAHYDLVLENINYFLELKRKKKKKLPVVRISLVLIQDNQNHLDEFIDYWLGRVDYVAVQSFRSFDSEYSKSVALPKRSNEIPGKNCSSPWERITIQGDGEVLPCCSQIARPLSIGNINESSIYDIWNSSGIKTIREKLTIQNFKKLPICLECLGG